MQKEKRWRLFIILSIAIVFLIILSIFICIKFIIPGIKESLTKIDLEKYSYKLSIKEVKLWITGGGIITLERGKGQANITDIRFIFYKPNGESEKINKQGSPNEFEIITYNFSSEELNFPIDKISIIPIMSNKLGPEINEDLMRIRNDWDGRRTLEFYDDSKIISWWKMDVDSSSAAPDSISKNHGNLFGNAKIIKKELLLDGESDYVDIGNPLNLEFSNDTKLTLTAWIFPINIKNEDGIISNSKNILPHNIRFSLGFTSLNYMNLKIGDGISYPQEIIFNKKSIDLDHWNFIAITLEKIGENIIEIKYYHNGIEIDSNRITNKLGISTDSWKIGKNYLENSDFNGKMKNIMIFGKTLSPSEINSLFIHQL